MPWLDSPFKHCIDLSVDVYSLHVDSDLHLSFIIDRYIFYMYSQVSRDLFIVFIFYSVDCDLC